jgi:hypothetical protein
MMIVALHERDNMTLSEYFEKAKGFGILATTDLAGQMNQAIYAKPLFLDKDDEQTCSFIMANRLTHDNVGHNPSAAYLFIEKGIHLLAHLNDASFTYPGTSLKLVYTMPAVPAD